MTIQEEIQSIKQRYGIIGNSPLLNHAIQVAVQVAPTDMTVMITGESGSGKESFSKIIHSLSTRKHGPFIAINCGAIPEGTIDSELFGHEKGSFTGAHDARKGYFEVTDKGTIFLDEIGEMPLGTQARLLRVLENKEFIRVGSSKIQKTDVRVIAATHQNLLQSVEKGRFREDLYYRLNTVPIFVPPLRERGEDIELIFRKFSLDFADKYRISPIKLTEEAKAELLKFRFPGNIRQLKNLAEQISVLETNREISKETLLKYLPSEKNLPALLRDNKGNHKEDFSERDILYKILFDMKKDVSDLKKLVNTLMQEGNYNPQLMKQHEQTLAEHDYTTNAETETAITSPTYLLPDSKKTQPINIDTIQDIVHEEDDKESLSLDEIEKEMIVKALKRNKNKRKYAAKDLGISERTLYRKIKQYQIEED
ncbi:MAG TPA: sigma-54 dependent transcriptional regulator [Cytophagaceae bacterium]|jgi:transcriptional regulator with PAS, ATPase and Fis domain|nr:sigma-54 dependent transcriptional regulator [Cytophagaceae bacterium]